MGVQYRCGSERRRRAVSAKAELSGIDYLEVSPSGGPLLLALLKDAPAPALAPDNILITSAGEARPVRVAQVAQTGAAYRLTIDAAGDSSVYTLRLRGPGGAGPPAGIDPQLAEVAFTFRSAAPADLGAALPATRAPAEPEISYLAKDYASFRRLMLDRMATLLPGGVEDQPADLQVALVELLSYTADRLSYYQDAVATEAYLGTARSRVSLRRHARLLDYRLHEGCNARVWVRCAVEARVEVGKDWRFLTQGAAPLGFEPCHYPVLHPQHNHVAVYGWGEDDFSLPTGTTRATLMPLHPGEALVVGPDGLAPGALLLLEAPGSAGLAALRHVVRLVEVAQGSDPLVDPPRDVVEVAWGAEDALPFALPVCGAGVPPAVACANIVLADQGVTVRAEDLGAAPARGQFRPQLRAGPITCADPLPGDLNAPTAAAALSSAAALLRRDLRTALPVITLRGDGEDWCARGDLLAAGAEAAFVIESERDGSAHLRFGDGIYGRRPAPQSAFSASYRVGNGRVGNVAAESICRIEGQDGWGVSVSNPLPACGGEEPEPAEQARLFAPQAFRAQERAVAADDYTVLAQGFPGVQKAAAAIRWTGSWYTVYLFIDRIGGRVVDDAFRQRMRDYLERYRLAGYDLEICGPTFVPLDLELAVDVRPGFAPGAVRAAQEAALGSGEMAGGRRGFFHPDSWSFGQPVHLSQIYQAALALPGVASVDATRFGRLGQPEPLSRERGVIAIGPHEIARLDAQGGRLTIKAKVTYDA